MQTTSNLGLKKPEGTDVVDINDFNDNADILDGKFASSVGHKHTGAAGDGPKIESTGLANGAATDSIIGSRTISDAAAPSGDSGVLTTLLGWLANMIKAITGKSNWRTAPATTLEAANTHHNATNAHSATSAATANRMMMRDANSRAKVAAPAAADDIARKDTVDAHANRTDNPHGVTKAQVSLGSVENYGIASQVEAEAGALNNKYMTPQRTAQAIASFAPVKSVAGKTGIVTLVGTDIPAGTTAARGTVQLSTSTSSTSTTLAATPSAVKAAYDRANEAFQSASDGKTAVASAITAKGVTASPADTFAALAGKIGQIETGDYNVGDAIPINKLQSAMDLTSITTQWMKTVTSGTISTSIGRHIVVATDSDGNVYGIMKPAVGYHFFLKYNPAGVELWRIHIDGITELSGNRYYFDYITDMVIDEDLGIAYILGFSEIDSVGYVASLSMNNGAFRDVIVIDCYGINMSLSPLSPYTPYTKALVVVAMEGHYLDVININQSGSFTSWGSVDLYSMGVGIARDVYAHHRNAALLYLGEGTRMISLSSPYSPMGALNYFLDDSAYLGRIASHRGPKHSMAYTLDGWSNYSSGVANNAISSHSYGNAGTSSVVWNATDITTNDALDLDVDKYRNVYVINNDGFIIKINPDGEWLWRSSFTDLSFYYNWEFIWARCHIDKSDYRSLYVCNVDATQLGVATLFKLSLPETRYTILP